MEGLPRFAGMQDPDVIREDYHVSGKALRDNGHHRAPVGSGNGKFCFTHSQSIPSKCTHQILRLTEDSQKNLPKVIKDYFEVLNISEDEDASEMVTFVQTEAEVMKAEVRTITELKRRQVDRSTKEGRKNPQLHESTNVCRACLPLHEVQTVILKMGL